MMIIRAPRPQENFVIIRNETIRDDGLSYRSRGILAYLLSMPDNWSTSSQVLSRPGEGRDVVRSCFNELVDMGYMVQVQTRDSTGRMASQWCVFDTPQSDSPAPGSQAPVPPAHTRESPGGTEDGFTGAGFIVPIKKTVGKKTVSTRKLSASDPPGFKEWYGVYPLHKDPANAKRKFVEALKVATLEELIEGARRYADEKARDGGFIKYPATWLHAGSWADEPTPARGKPPARKSIAERMGISDE